jgi:hypothetical protein
MFFCPRPLTQEEVLKPKEKKPMHWIIKTSLLGLTTIGFAYGFAFWIDAPPHEASAVHILTGSLGFLGIFGMIYLTVHCATNKGKLS